MSTISETLARSRDIPICFIDDKDVEEFLIEFGIAGQLNQKQEGRDRDVQFLACLNHPTHYLLAMRNRDYVNPEENGYMLTCVPKCSETVEHFMQFCKKTVKQAEETVRKLWASAESQGKVKLDNPEYN